MNVSQPNSTGKILRVFIGDLLLVGALLVIVEVLLRLFAPQQVHHLLQHVYEPWEHGYRFKAGSSVICNNGYGDHRFAVNSWHARDRDFGPKAPGELRLLSVGNSYNENQALELDDIWTKVLESNLSASHPGRRFSVVNAGQAGWGLRYYYHYLEEQLPNIDPDIVIIVFGNTHDLKNWRTHPRPKPMAIWNGLPIRRNSSALDWITRYAWYANELMEGWSHAYVAFRKWTYYPGIWLGVTRVSRIHPVFKSEAYGEKLVQPTVDLVQSIDELCSRHGAQLIMLSIPREEEVVPEEGRLRIELERPDVSSIDFGRARRLVRRVAEGAGVLCYDPGPDLAAAEEETYFNEFKHWNVLGNRITARGLQRFIEDRGLLH